MKRVALTVIVFSLLGALPAAAETPLSGYFIARQACPALQSIRNQTNPGEVLLVIDRAYPLKAKNKDEATHYLIEVAGVEPARRWVGVSCGEHVVPFKEADKDDKDDDDDAEDHAGAPPSGDRPFAVLAASWQPAFCDLNNNDRKPECRSQTSDRFDASHFSLHGLWPKGAYCGVPAQQSADDKNHAWDRLPEPALQAGTRKRLEVAMPGTQSHLDRHEWIKHGTCFGGRSAEAYFSRSLALLGQLNDSKVRDLFASHVGAELTGEEIRAAFDASFGAGAGKRVRISCKQDNQRRIISELTIGLVGDIGDDPSLKALIAAAAPTDAGCPKGIVDAVGAQ